VQHSDRFVAELTNNQNRLYAYVLSLLGNPSAAQDVLQAANLVLWKKSNDWDPATEFIPWAFAVARYEVMTWRKQAARDRLVFSERTLELLDRDRQSEVEAFDHREEALIGCLEELSAKHRELLDRRYMHDTPVQEMARQSGSEPNAVAQALFRARQALAKCMRRKLGQEGPS